MTGDCRTGNSFTTVTVVATEIVAATLEVGLRRSSADNVVAATADAVAAVTNSVSPPADSVSAVSKVVFAAAKIVAMAAVAARLRQRWPKCWPLWPMAASVKVLAELIKVTAVGRGSESGRVNQSHCHGSGGTGCSRGLGHGNDRGGPRRPSS